MLYDLVVQSIIADVLKNINNIPNFLYLTYVHKENLEFILDDVLMMLNKEKAINRFEKILNECKNIGGTFWDEMLYILSHKKYAVYMKQHFWSNFILQKIESEKNTNFAKYTQNLFDTFNWSNVVVAGGSIAKIMDPEFDKKLVLGAYNNSDIDLFLHGSTKTKKKKLQYIFKYLSSKLGKYAIKFNENVVTIYSTNYHIPIQIICCSNKTLTQVVMNFTMSHQQIMYDGKHVYCTHNYNHAMETKMSYCFDDTMKPELVIKTIGLGFQIVPSGFRFFDDWVEWVIDNYSAPKPLINKKFFFEKLKSYNRDRFTFDPYLQEKEQKKEELDAFSKRLIKFNTHFDGISY